MVLAEQQEVPAELVLAGHQKVAEQLLLPAQRVKTERVPLAAEREEIEPVLLKVLAVTRLPPDQRQIPLCPNRHCQRTFVQKQVQPW